jgi:hypothetical protein
MIGHASLYDEGLGHLLCLVSRGLGFFLKQSRKCTGSEQESYQAAAEYQHKTLSSFHTT